MPDSAKIIPQTMPQKPRVKTITAIFPPLKMKYIFTAIFISIAVGSASAFPVEEPGPVAVIQYFGRETSLICVHAETVRRHL
jgi:hypothetical protein